MTSEYNKYVHLYSAFAEAASNDKLPLTDIGFQLIEAALNANGITADVDSIGVVKEAIALIEENTFDGHPLRAQINAMCIAGHTTYTNG